MQPGFWQSMLSKNLSSVGANRILKVTFIFCLYPLALVILLHIFFPESYVKHVGANQLSTAVAYTYGLIMSGLGIFILNKYLWACYSTAIVFLAPNVMSAVMNHTFPPFNFLDAWLAILLMKSYRSIKFLKSNNV